MKRAKNLTLTETTIQRAEDLMAALDVDSISALVALLVREEHERRHGLQPIKDKGGPLSKPPGPPDLSGYSKASRRKPKKKVA